MNESQHVPAIRIRRLQNGAGINLPSYMSTGAAGADICAAIDAPTTIAPRHTALIGTGFAMQIPDGYEIQLRPRSSLALRGITFLNTPATIDSDFRGEVCVLLINHGENEFTVQRGERIAQLILAPVHRATFEEVAELEPSDRGEGGFGSTG